MALISINLTASDMVTADHQKKSPGGLLKPTINAQNWPKQQFLKDYELFGIF